MHCASLSRSPVAPERSMRSEPARSMSCSLPWYRTRASVLRPVTSTLSTQCGARRVGVHRGAADVAVLRAGAMSASTSSTVRTGTRCSPGTTLPPPGPSRTSSPSPRSARARAARARVVEQVAHLLVVHLHHAHDDGVLVAVGALVGEPEELGERAVVHAAVRARPPSCASCPRPSGRTQRYCVGRPITLVTSGFAAEHVGLRAVDAEALVERVARVVARARVGALDRDALAVGADRDDADLVRRRRLPRRRQKSTRVRASWIARVGGLCRSGGTAFSTEERGERRERGGNFVRRARSCALARARA